MFELLTTFMRKIRGKVTELRRDVTMTRAGLEDIYTEVVAIQSDIVACEGLAAIGMERATKGLAILGIEGMTEEPEVFRGEGVTKKRVG